MNERELLFSKYDLRSAIEAQENEMYQAIDAVEPNRLLNASVDDLADYFEQDYRIAVPQITDDQIAVAQEEAKVDVSQDPMRVIFDRSQPFYAPGTTITFYVPFAGDAVLFKCKPSAFDLNPPRAEIRGSGLVVGYRVLEHNAEAIKAEFQQWLGAIRRWLGRINNDVAGFNSSVRDKAKKRVEARREKLLKDQGLVAELGFPLRQRKDAPTTYVTPEVRRKVRAKMPTATNAPFVPEPALDLQEYEHILSVISQMSLVLERSPGAFKNMKEEDLRQHFLVQLNAQYEGEATGETFNFEGKTDILIRNNGKNIFIAECMFWDGPKSLERKLDQLLGYACWRDTKTAILVFNRGKSLSAVLEKIPGVATSHPDFKREAEYESETGSRYVFHHRDNENRELTLTILAFEVPR